MHSLEPDRQHVADSMAEKAIAAKIVERDPAVVAIEEGSAEKEKLNRLDHELHCWRSLST